MTLTPKQAQQPILRALGALTSNQAGVAVSSREVTEEVLRNIGFVPDNLAKARNMINFAATQSLRSMGLLAPAEEGVRGMWALSELGVATLLGAAPLPPKAAPTPSEEPTVEAPVEEPTVEVPPSPWADDPEGVVVAWATLADTYSTDPYILALAQKTPCFGSRSDCEVCRSCPIARSCQDKLFERYATLVPLEKNEPESKKSPTSLGGIMDDLERGLSGEASPVEPPVEPPGISKAPPVESICYRCRKTLPANKVETYVPGKGYRHTLFCLS